MKEYSQEVKLARKSLAYYLENHEFLPLPLTLPPELEKRAGVFVSLKQHGELRGCIGTFMPTKKNIAEEIIHNAVSAGVDDPRFWPVEMSELEEIEFSVDVLTEPVKVSGIQELDAQKYGVIVKNKGRAGLLLPDLAGVETVQEQLAIARQKAGIGEEEAVELYRFSVIRYH